MTVKELRALIKGLPSHIKIVIGIGDSLEDICTDSAGVAQIQFNDSDEKEFVFILPQCSCSFDESEVDGEINSRPELN